MGSTNQVRTYNRNESVVFWKTNEPFGGLSNMAGGFPLKVNGLRIPTSEALYQACRFPHKPDVQRLIIEQASPMTAKMKSKPYRSDSRPDWEQVRVKIMRWCLRVKLVQNWQKFSKLLLETGDRPIVEQSRKDDFWGAKPVGDQTLVGMNVLGRLLMELREEVRRGGRAAFLRVEPLAIPNFLLLGKPIQPVIAEGEDQHERGSPVQATLFNQLNQPLQHRQRGTAAEMPVQAKLFELPEQEAGAESQGSADSSRMDIPFTLNPYPAYKDSGVPWLGQVPEHWEVRRLGAVVQILNGATPSSSRPEYWDGDIVWVTPEDLGKLKGRYIDNSSRRITQDGYNACGTTLAPAGSIVLSTRAPIGHLGILRVAACANQGCRLLVPHTVTTGDFLYHMLLAARPSLEVLGQGSTFLELSRSKLGMFPIPLPPLPEQTAIVRFLEHMDRRIRRVIHARQRQIKLLEEYRQALIHQAITGQIDVRTGKPYPAYKDSGVPWLGQVPEHWEVMPLKRLAWFKSGTGFPVHHQGDTSAEIPFFKVSDMNTQGNEKYLRTCANTVTLRLANSLGATIFPAGTIVFPKVGGALLTNKRRITVKPCCVDNNVMACVPINGNCDFLFLVMTWLDLGQIAKPGPVPAISEGEVGEIRVAVPPPPEQTAIVEYLDAETAKIDAAIAALRREIELLREYRERLIADVVTGKVDVREVAARLPEEPSEEDAPWTDEEESAQDEALNGEGDHAAISEEDG
jgi:type I restriction enzyme S subunit